MNDNKYSHIRDFYPLLNYDGTLIQREMEKYLFYGDACAQRLRTIIGIVKAKIIKHVFENNNNPSLTCKELIHQLCPEDLELAKETSDILDKVVKEDQFISKINANHPLSKLELDENFIIFDLFKGPVLYEEDFDSLINYSIGFQSIEIKEFVLWEMKGLYYDRIFHDGDRSFRYLDIKGNDLNYLNQMVIYKSKTIDCLQTPNGDLYLCVDANKRYHDGDTINTEKAMMCQYHTCFSVVVIY